MMALLFPFWQGAGELLFFSFLVQSLPLPLAYAKNGD